MTQTLTPTSLRETIKENNLNHTLFSWAPQGALNPIIAETAKDATVYDVDGTAYLDFSSQLMNVNLGHSNEAVKTAMKEQIDKLAFVFPGMATEPRGDLGKALCDIAPGNLTKAFFTNAGADAIENAIKIARVFTGRHKVIAKYRSYHGATYGAITAGGDPRKFAVDANSAPNIVHVEDPYCYRCPFGQKDSNSCQYECTAHIERVIQFENPDSIAAIILEGESGSSGCIKYPPNYMKNVKKIAEKYGILLIVDEVMSGFGRCGEWFGIENHGVEPDLLVTAKGLTTGYFPLGAVLVREDIAAFFDTTPLPCGLTYSGHAVGCAAANAVISEMKRLNINEEVRKKEAYVNQKVEELKAKHPSIGDFRNTGLLGCLELVKNRESKEPLAPWNAKASEMGIMSQVAATLKEEGLSTFVRWNWIFIAPPLTISYEDLDRGFNIISRALSVADTATTT